MTIRTRFAPSPTGLLHLGGARTALFAYLLARSQNGQYYLRIDDTDQVRSDNLFLTNIYQSLEWLNLEHDDLYYQSKRIDIYQKNLLILIEKKISYKSDDGTIKFRQNNYGHTSWDDLVQGKIIIHNNTIEDWVICRSDQTFTYNFASIIDDIDMGITIIIRGCDHISNTAKQINLLKAFNTSIQFAHLPLIKTLEGRKLSKRDQAEGILSYKREGILPQALRNYLLRLGWSNKDQEIFSFEEMKNIFSLQGIHKSPASFSKEKINWFNKVWMKKLPLTELIENFDQYLVDKGKSIFDHIDKNEIIQAFVSRSNNFHELEENISFFCSSPTYTTQINLDHQKLLSLLEGKEINLDYINSYSKLLSIDSSIIYKYLRISLTGSAYSVPLALLLKWLKKELIYERLNNYARYCQNTQKNLITTT
jgi:glutamyl-tRNA synthetase